jgi:hypothetical protein
MSQISRLAAGLAVAQSPEDFVSSVRALLAGWPWYSSGRVMKEFVSTKCWLRRRGFVQAFYFGASKV